MNQSLFSENFHFLLFSYCTYHYNDARQGNDCHYIGFMRKGEGRLTDGKTTLLVKEGELFYIPMGFCYESHWSGSPEVTFDSYAFSYFPRPSFGTYPLQKIPTTPKILERLEALATHKTVDCHSIGCLYLLLDAILPVMRVENFGNKQVVVDEAIRYMQGAVKCNIPDLARYCRISESGLYSAFRTVKKCTPVEMWHRVQSERAVNLLLTTDLSIEAISDRLGFCSTSYFRKILRATTGKTPREIRKSESV